MLFVRFTNLLCTDNFQVSLGVGQKMSFSSYPGAIVSTDDFYIMDSGLVMLETTNTVYNQTLYQYITPEATLV